MSKNCVTHHHACDCREDKFKQLEEKIKLLEKREAKSTSILKQWSFICPCDKPDYNCSLCRETEALLNGEGNE